MVSNVTKIMKKHKNALLEKISTFSSTFFFGQVVTK
jgi:hypothetical protein